MKNTASFRRNAAAVGLATTAVLSAVSVTLQPEFPSGYVDRLAAIDGSGVQGQISAVTFLVAQLPFIAAILGIAHLLRDRAPILSNLGATFGLIGAFGHTVFGGMSLVYITMASDQTNRDVYATLWERLEGSPVMVFAAMGLLGTVLGIVLLSIGIWRSRVAPRWVPLVLWIFLVVEFVGTSLSEYAAPVSGVLFVIAFGQLAVVVWRSPLANWSINATSHALGEEPVLPSAS